MSDFLNFLNNASADMLTQAQGINRSLAENIIAARPFTSADDCLKVKGMGKMLLARLQSAAEAQEKSSENSAMLQVTQDAPPAPIEKSQPAQESAVEKKPSFWSRLGQAFLTFIRALFRLIALVIIIGGIGIAVYFGMIFINENLITPIQRNAVQVHQLETEMAALRTQLDEMNARIGVVESTIETQTASMAKLEEMQAALEVEISNQNNSMLVTLKREVMLTRSIETVARARLFLSQSNFGLARDDVQTARDILAELLIDAPAYQVDSLNQIVMRLDFALSNLPAFPIIAVDDVDIAWQLMMMGLPQSEADVVETFTPTPPQFPTFTTTPEATLEATATPLP